MKALKISYTDGSDVTNADSVSIIEDWKVNRNDGTPEIVVSMDTYKDQTACEENKDIVVNRFYKFYPETTNIGHTDDYMIGLVAEHADFTGATEITI